MRRYLGITALLFGLTSGPAAAEIQATCSQEVSSRLLATVSPHLGGTTGDRLVVDLLLQNNSEERVRIGSWLVLSTCKVRERVVHVKTDEGIELERFGRDVGFGAPETYEFLAPGDSIRIEGLDITAFYAFPAKRKRLWMWFDSIAWVDVNGPQCVDVKSKAVPFQFVPTTPRKPGIPPEGRVVQRIKRAHELVITCSGP